MPWRRRGEAREHRSPGNDLLFLRGRCRCQEGSGWRLKVSLKSIRHGRLRERGVIEMSGCGMLLLLLLLLLLLFVSWKEWLDLCRCILAVKAPDGNEWAELIEGETRWQAGV